MSKWADLRVRTLSAIVLIAGLAIILFALPRHAYDMLLVCIWAILLFEWVNLTRMRNYKWLWFVGGFLYITPAIAGLWTIHALFGSFSVVALIFAVAMIDMGGYFVGKYFGNHKIWPSVSPGKTWEGLLGSYLFCVIGMIVFRMALGNQPESLPIENAMLISFVFTALALGGDLFESALKRRAGVKDSGRLIPGHGGLFDRLDALLPCAWLAGLAGLLFVYLIGMAR